MAKDKSKQPEAETKGEFIDLNGHQVPVYAWVKSVHLGVGTDLLMSKQSLQERAGNELALTPFGIFATGKSGRRIFIPHANIKGAELVGTVEREAKDKIRQEAIDAANEQRRLAAHTPGVRATVKPKTEPVPEVVSQADQEQAIANAAAARASAKERARQQSQEKIDADIRKGVNVQRSR